MGSQSLPGQIFSHNTYADCKNTNTNLESNTLQCVCVCVCVSIRVSTYACLCACLCMCAWVRITFYTLPLNLNGTHYKFHTQGIPSSAFEDANLT